MEEGSIERCHHRNHHEQEHTGTKREENGEPQAAFGDDGHQKEDRDEHRPEEDLGEKAEDEVSDSEAFHGEGKIADGTADHGSQEVENKHQDSGEKGDEDFGQGILRSFGPDGEEVLGKAALEVARDEDQTRMAERK